MLFFLHMLPAVRVGKLYLVREDRLHFRLERDFGSLLVELEEAWCSRSSSDPSLSLETYPKIYFTFSFHSLTISIQHSNGSTRTPSIHNSVFFIEAFPCKNVSRSASRRSVSQRIHRCSLVYGLCRRIDFHDPNHNLHQKRLCPPPGVSVHNHGSWLVC